MDPTAIVGAYVTENSLVSDTTYTLGTGMLYGWTVTSGIVKVSRQLVQDSAIDVDSLVAARTGEAIGRKIATEVVSGLGPASKAYTGIIPSLDSFGSGHSSGGYISLGTATTVKTFGSPSGVTEITGNVLAPATCFSMIDAVDPAYWYEGQGCAFYMTAAQALNQRQVIDSNGRPLINLDHSYDDGVIGTIGGFPVRVVNDLPVLTASTTGGPVFGNLEHAMVLRTVRGGNLLRLVERFADYLQIGFLQYTRGDSQPVDLRAAVTVKPSTS